MSKELQAFENIIVDSTPHLKNANIEEIKIVETALKEKEQQENLINELCDYAGLDNLFPYKNFKEIEKVAKERIDQHTILKVDRQTDAKKLKALEIIKNKILDMDYFNIIADNCNLTFQEYNLLMEVLK